MKRHAKIAAERLTKVLMSDKIGHPEHLHDLIKNDVYELLDNYFELYPDTLEVGFDTASDALDIRIRVRARRTRNYGSFNV